MTKDDKIAIENVNQPGKTYNVDAAKYSAMRECMIQIVPTEPPGISAQEMYDALIPALPQELWPNDEKVGWWQKGLCCKKFQQFLCRQGQANRVILPYAAIPNSPAMN